MKVFTTFFSSRSTLMESIRIPEGLHELRSRLFSELSYLIVDVMARKGVNITVELAGSIALGTDLAASDMDIVVFPYDTDLHQKKVLMMLRHEIKRKYSREDRSFKISAIMKAVVKELSLPLVTLSLSHTHTHTHVHSCTLKIPPLSLSLSHLLHYRCLSSNAQSSVLILTLYATNLLLYMASTFVSNMPPPAPSSALLWRWWKPGVNNSVCSSSWSIFSVFIRIAGMQHQDMILSFPQRWTRLHLILTEVLFPSAFLGAACEFRPSSEGGLSTFAWMNLVIFVYHHHTFLFDSISDQVTKMKMKEYMPLS